MLHRIEADRTQMQGIRAGASHFFDGEGCDCLAA
jgi:hypothetical protein